MYYCYVISSSLTKRLYVGAADNLKIEFKKHNEGRIENTTADTPWNLVWYGGFTSEKKAEEFANYLRSEGRYYIEKWFMSETQQAIVSKSSSDKTCPICGGSGLAANSSLAKKRNKILSNLNKCLTCGGRGWISPLKEVPGYDA